MPLRSINGLFSSNLLYLPSCVKYPEITENNNQSISHCQYKNVPCVDVAVMMLSCMTINRMVHVLLSGIS